MRGITESSLRSTPKLDPLCPPELKEFGTKLHAMKSSVACIMVFHLKR